MEILNKFIKFITTSGDNKIHEADSSIFDRIRIDFFNKDFCHFLPEDLFEYKLMQFESCCSNAFSVEGYNSFVSAASYLPEGSRPKSQFEYYLGLSLSVLKDLLILKFLYKNDYVSKLQSIDKKYTYIDEFGDIERDEVYKKFTKFADRHFYSLTTGLIDVLPDYIINLPTNNPFDFEHVDAKLISYDLCSCIGDVNDSTKHLSNIEMDITDPYEYEEYIAQCMISLGWHAHSTKGSGDQGADVLAEKNGIKVVVQCKLYGQPVGNKAVQEVYSAKGFYECDVAIVVTNSSFTKSAMQLSSSLDVHLVHDSELAHFFLKYNQSDSNESEYITEEHDPFEDFPTNDTNFVADVAKELVRFGWDVQYNEDDEDDVFDVFGNFNKLIVASKNGTNLLGKCIHYENDEVNISEVKDFCEFFTRHREEYNNDLGIFVLKNNVSKKLIEEFNKLDNIEDIYLISLNSISNINDIVA